MLNNYFIRSERFSALFAGFLACLFLSNCSAQTVATGSPYGLKIIQTEEEYRLSVTDKPEHVLVDLSDLSPKLQFDLAYTTDQNFVGEILYPAIRTSYLRKAASDKLQKANLLFEAKGYGILIFDAYRPYSVTERMWESVPDSRYAADPRYGSGHNRGISVDLTLVDLRTGQVLDMGTGFDNFSDTAHIDFLSLPEAVQKNRALLLNTMQQAGFTVLDTEWWHFYLPDSKSYPLMNLTFSQIEGILRTGN